MKVQLEFYIIQVMQMLQFLLLALRIGFIPLDGITRHLGNRTITNLQVLSIKLVVTINNLIKISLLQLSTVPVTWPPKTKEEGPIT